jgi:hypothetical protein
MQSCRAAIATTSCCVNRDAISRPFAVKTPFNSVPYLENVCKLANVSSYHCRAHHCRVSTSSCYIDMKWQQQNVSSSKRTNETEPRNKTHLATLNPARQKNQSISAVGTTQAGTRACPEARIKQVSQHEKQHAFLCQKL